MTMRRVFRHAAATLAAVAACALGGVAGSHVAPQASDPNLQYEFTTHATALNEALLTGYNKFIPPRSRRRNSTGYGSEAGTDVEVQLRFYKVASVLTAEGRLEMQTWMRLYFGMTQTHAAPRPLFVAPLHASPCSPL